MRLRLRTRGKLMLANFRLKIRAVWDSDIENRSSNFSHKWKAFGRNNLLQVSYLPKSYLWTKNERNWFFNSCHEIKRPWLKISRIRRQLQNFIIFLFYLKGPFGELFSKLKIKSSIALYFFRKIQKFKLRRGGPRPPEKQWKILQLR